MEARIHVITLAVDDLERALKFYRDGLGLESQGIIGTEWLGDETHPAGAIVMFQLQGGLILTVYPRSELAKDANVPFGPVKTGEFSIGHAVASKAAVDAVLAQAKAAGARLSDGAHERPWGIYSGYFQDPDGHLWEIMFNPQLELASL
jgi:catechol 2,3-dioxygenase-like lactoylglutathione lyase family enzyme